MTEPLFYQEQPVEAMRFDGTPENATLIIDWMLKRGQHAQWRCTQRPCQNERSYKGHELRINHVATVPVGAYVVMHADGTLEVIMDIEWTARGFRHIEKTQGELAEEPNEGLILNVARGPVTYDRIDVNRPYRPEEKGIHDTVDLVIELELAKRAAGLREELHKRGYSNERIKALKNV